MTEAGGTRRRLSWHVDARSASIGVLPVFLFAEGVWLVPQPLIYGISDGDARASFAIWIVGFSVIIATPIILRRVRARPFREALARKRAAHHDEVVFGIRLDPVSSPLGQQWADARDIHWGFLRVAPEGLVLERSDGTVMLSRPWAQVEIDWGALPEIHVSGGPGGTAEEWWFQFVSEAGYTARGRTAERMAAEASASAEVMRERGGSNHRSGT